MFPTICHEFKAVAWKCCKVRKNAWLRSVIARVLPILLYLVVANYYGKVGKLQTDVSTTFGYKQSAESLYSALGTYEFYYAPHNPFTQKIMTAVQKDVQIPAAGLHGFSNQGDLQEKYEKFVDADDNFLIVIFNGPHFNESTIPMQLNYTIRKRDFVSTGANYYDTTIGPGSGLGIYEDFAALQLCINSNFLRLRGGLDFPVSVTMEEFPYPEYTNARSMMELYLTFFPVFTMLCFDFLAASVILNIVEEKRSGVKELMKMMGLNPTIMWTALFLESVIWALIPIIGVIVLISVPFGNNVVAALPTSNPVLLFLFVLLYYCACTSFAFALSTLSGKPAVAVTISLGVSVVSIGAAVSLFYGVILEAWSKYLLSLLPNGALVYGYMMIHDLETRKDTGLQWSTLFQASNAEGGHDYMGVVFLMLIGQTIFYMLLALYLDAVRPGKYGIPKKWNFFIDPIKGFLRTKCFEGSSSEVTPLRTDTIVETSDLRAPVGIEIVGLHKRYENNVVALENLHAAFPKGQINVLLGENGAGKSTTMNILTGMTNYIHGSVTVLGYDLKRNLKKIRSMIGVCPQNDLYFERLSVYDHFKFVAMLNGAYDVDSKVKDMLGKLDLTEHKDKFPTNLSGGMKRKLCFGMSLVSDPQVLILDEPTSGLDPVSRRKLWDILLEWRRNQRDPKTVLLSTHVLEEAEALGDKIAVLGGGKLLVHGSLSFLRENFGTGYTLTVSFNSALLSSSKIDEEVKETIEKSTKIVEKCVDNILVYTISQEEQHKFGTLLENIEKLGVQNVTIQAATLDDLFMNITKKHDMEEMEEKECDRMSATNGCLSPTILKVIWILLKYQLKIFNWQLFGLECLVALLVIGCGFYYGDPMKITGVGGDSSLLMDFSIYGNTTVYYSGDKSNPLEADLMDKYRKLVMEKGGTPEQVPSIQDALLEVGRRNILDYPMHSITGAEFSQSKYGVEVNIVYSEKARHAAPISINLIYNTLSRLLNNTDQADTFITTSDSLSSMGNFKSLGTIVVLCMVPFIALALLVIINFAVEIPFYNRIDGMKHLQIMTGVSISVYWFSMFLFHILIYLLVIFLICVEFAFFSIVSNYLLQADQLGALVVILLVYGITGILFAFCASHWKSVSSISSFIFSTNLITTIIGSTAIFLLEFVYEQKEWATAVDLILQAFPTYWVFYALKNLFQKATDNYQWKSMDELSREKFCHVTPSPCCSVNGYVSEQDCSTHQSYFAAINLCQIFLHLVCAVFFYLLILCLCEMSYWRRFWRKCRAKPNDQTRSNGSSKHPMLQLAEVSMTYNSLPVVRNVSFDINSNKCFGMLGPNGAGKSTTFKVLTGQILPDDGMVKADQISIRSNYSEYLQKIGYCPQENMFNGKLSGRQMLTHLGELRNIPNSELKENVEKCIKLIGLDEEMVDRRCSKYSGGNKRKLSVGLALIGLPKAIVMDEPTTGVDPASRRLLWNTIRKVKQQNCAILLSSHIMLECEALCDELLLMKPLKQDESKTKRLDTIMYKGGTLCGHPNDSCDSGARDLVQSIVITGTVPDVKAKLGKGVMILIKLKYELLGVSKSKDEEELTVDELKRVFMKTFPTGVLKEEHLSQLSFYLPSNGKCSLSLVYKQMEGLKESFSVIHSYTVNTATLEDVILDLATQT